MVEINKFTEVPSFSDGQLDKQLDKQVRFLKTIYPFLNDEDVWNEGAIELRPLRRDTSLKHYVRSYNAWHILDDDMKSLKDFLSMINGKGYCLYYSSFAFDFHKDVLKSDGKLYQKGKINNKNALFTTILAMDFDDMSLDEFNKEKQKLSDLDLETIDIMTGHGFQSLILLNKRVYDKDILKKFTNLLIAKGFKVDETIKDPARVLRMPYSFNCKAVDKNSKYFDELSPGIIATTDVSWTERRYHVVDVFEKLNLLEDVIPQERELTDIEIKSIPTAPMFEIEKKKEEKQIKEVMTIKIENLETVYSMLSFRRLPEAIQKMLNGTQDGLRNQVILFLIPFFRNSLGFNIQLIKQIMTIWGQRCSPVLDESFIIREVDRIYGYGLKAPYGAFTEELCRAYGYLEFSEFTRKNKVLIPNSFFNDCSEISDGAIRIYFAVKLSESINGINQFTQKDIELMAGISSRTFFRNINDLTTMSYLCKKRANRRLGEEYIYYINPYFSSVDGFTMLENALVKMMLQELTNGEMKIYSYLAYMIGNSKSECWASQKYISKRVGKTQQGISLITDKLSDKKFITKKTYKKGSIMHSTYNLNY